MSSLPYQIQIQEANTFKIVTRKIYAIFNIIKPVRTLDNHTFLLNSNLPRNRFFNVLPSRFTLQSRECIPKCATKLHTLKT